MYRIDDVTKMTGLTKRALRYYEEIGLVQPPQRTKGNARLYSEGDIAQLKKVVEAKEVLGFSLQELQEFIDLKRTIEESKQHAHVSSQDVMEIEKLLHKQIEMISLKMSKMQSFKDELNRVLDKAEQIRITKQQEER